MRPVIIPLLAVLVLGAQPAPPAPTPDEIARAVRQLGDDEYIVREKASDFLWRAGAAAGAALRDATKNADPEVARRAEAVLARFARADFPGTPKPVVELGRRYWAAKQGEKDAVIRQICWHGVDGYSALTRLLQASDDAAVRGRLSKVMADQVVELVPMLLAQGKAREIERILELEIDSGLTTAAWDYAVWQAMHGRAADKAREHQQRADGAWPQAVIMLHLIAGDKQKALEAVARPAGAPLRNWVYFQTGTWAELAKAELISDSEVERLGFRAAFHRLAGNAGEAQRAIEDLCRLPTDDPPRRINLSTPNQTMEALLVNERPADAVAILRKSPEQYHSLAFRLLVQQVNYREAFELVDRAVRGSKRIVLDLAVARTLVALGERDRARLIFAGYSRAMKEAQDGFPYYFLVESEYQAGFTEEALADCAWTLTNREDVRSSGWLLDVVFPDRKPAASAIWATLRRMRPEEAPVDTLAKLTQLCRDGWKGPEFSALIRDFMKTALEGERNDLFNPLAEFCERSGQNDLARPWYEQRVMAYGDADLLVDLGDFLARQKFWNEAADRYGQAWEKVAPRLGVDANDRGGIWGPLALYLRGWALRQAGRVAEGRELQERALLMPLGRAEARDELVRVLAKHDTPPVISRQLSSTLGS